MSQLIEDPTTSQFDRLPPFDLSAEKGVLGSMILDRDMLADILDVIDREDFFQADNQLIFDALVRMFQREADVIDTVTLRDELTKHGVFEEVGGKPYLIAILDSVVSGAHGMHYARIVKEKSLLRAIIAASNDSLRDAYAPHEQAVDVLAKVERRVFEIAERQGRTRDEPVLMQAALQEAIEAAENKGSRGIETGFFELDDILNGLHNGEMIILAARPSIGKTAMACCIAEHLSADTMLPGAIFSLEMGKREIAARMMCQRAGVNSQQMRKGMLGSVDYAKLAQAVAEMTEAPIYISDGSALTGLQLMSACRRLKRRHGIRYVIIDYLQLMTGSARAERDSRQQEISEISRMVKATARELDIPVIALCQLNRRAEMRGRPKLSDLRESGSLEQDADVVMLLHREDFNHIHEPDFQPDNIAEVIIAKQRNGPTGVVKLTFLSRSMRFENLSTQPDPEIS